MIPSASLGGIGWGDFYSVAGCESAFLAFDENDPQDIFGGCYQGLIDRWNRTTGLQKPIMAYPFLGLGTYAGEQRYRFNWNAPIVASPHDPATIYHAGNVVFATRDRGQSWEAISPDLTRDEEDKQGAGGTPITNEGAGGENYNTIMALVESPHEAGTLWVGTDDGLVHVTRDGGGAWNDVTPPDVGRAMINSIEISPHDPATVYVVASAYKFNDFTPTIFRSRDYGASWESTTAGIEEDHWVRVVREDPVSPGLLYAGTEMGIFLSHDAGDSWEKWQLNLPIVPVTDLTFRNNDLVASTQGRGFWILDDLSPVQQVTETVMAGDMHLFTPRDAVMASFSGGFPGAGGGLSTGANPPSGAQIFYSFAEAPDSLVTVEILGADGSAIRTYATDPEAAGQWRLLVAARPEGRAQPAGLGLPPRRDTGCRRVPELRQPAGTRRRAGRLPGPARSRWREPHGRALTGARSPLERDPARVRRPGAFRRRRPAGHPRPLRRRRRARRRIGAGRRDRRAHGGTPPGRLHPGLGRIPDECDHGLGGRVDPAEAADLPGRHQLPQQAGRADPRPDRIGGRYRASADGRRTRALDGPAG
ncbi:MAG: hypothetical protein F4106_03230 [Gemmatimonadetes bacterium]|nr:hypothetical protein [Gemmatimonadota bacterium]